MKSNYQGVSEEAARLVARHVLRKPSAVLALPTGDTPKGMYRLLVRLHRAGLVNFSSVVTFNLDEYLGIPADHPQSFATYMRDHFWGPVWLEEGKAHIPASLPPDPEEECARYEQLIEKAGGIDLAVLGIGHNAHIGFNEPGTPWDSHTHVTQLAETTRRREAAAFGGLGSVPGQAITVGIKTIMHAQEVLLLASGEEKARPLAGALTGPLDPQLPASVLQLHPRLTVVADQAAAGRLPAHASGTAWPGTA
ncbi:MAG: glucosamine-6-phosphate deaminase [Candidatus Bipolaricaulaceae bacterium]